MLYNNFIELRRDVLPPYSTDSLKMMWMKRKKDFLSEGDASLSLSRLLSLAQERRERPEHVDFTRT